MRWDSCGTTENGAIAFVDKGFCLDRIYKIYRIVETSIVQWW